MEIFFNFIDLPEIITKKKKRQIERLELENSFIIAE